MSEKRAFLVSVRHNLVCEVGVVLDVPEVDIPATKLDVSAQLAAGHQARGCIDGDYYFIDSATARRFAFICQDFVKKMVDRTMIELEEGRFMPEEYSWRNPLLPQQRNSGGAECSPTSKSRARQS
jgi:hypothetical protein